MMPAARLEPALLAALTQINSDDILESLGLARVRHGRRFLTALFRPAAARFAREVAIFDALVAEKGLPASAEWILKRYLRRLEVAGRAHIPAHGPLLVLANHPGMADTVALFVGLGRPDLRIVALERPFLKALPHTSRQLIYVPEDERARLPVVRQVAAALRDGQAVLTFPAGEIEPDPAVLPGAVDSLEQWSESFAVFARLAPEARVLPAIVSGVLSPAAQRTPLARLRRQRKDRERVAAMLQVMLPIYQGVTVRIAFGAPAAAKDLLAACPEPADLKRYVVAQARRLIEQPPAGWETVTHGLR
jgi:1-acyl-sn-glycerol-3-phosphate acyltransferase